MHNIVVDHQRDLVFARVSGFLDAAMIAALIAEVRVVGQRLRHGANGYDLLCDLSETKVAATVAADSFSGLLNDRSTQHLWADRVAYFTPSTLLRLQIERAAVSRADIAVFAERRSAISWLQEERRKKAA
ncbi:hypothetical protein [Sphingomonas sp. 28-63-12]|uniref:hypothetical protein n=1 Tax=Sphingomonas sp. 28-63-12 TaxID=1970434 RepID=UPI000BCAF440|nr:MAG: hypothetical protein B7Y47_07975 [Sphingomonas sp. 28-63-12]